MRVAWTSQKWTFIQNYSTICKVKIMLRAPIRVLFSVNKLTTPRIYTISKIRRHFNRSVIKYTEAENITTSTPSWSWIPPRQPVEEIEQKIFLDESLKRLVFRVI